MRLLDLNEQSNKTQTSSELQQDLAISLTNYHYPTFNSIESIIYNADEIQSFKIALTNKTGGGISFTEGSSVSFDFNQKIVLDNIQITQISPEDKGIQWNQSSKDSSLIIAPSKPVGLSAGDSLVFRFSKVKAITNPMQKNICSTIKISYSKVQSIADNTVSTIFLFVDPPVRTKSLFPPVISKQRNITSDLLGFPGSFELISVPPYPNSNQCVYKNGTVFTVSNTINLQMTINVGTTFPSPPILTVKFYCKEDQQDTYLTKKNNMKEIDVESSDENWTISQGIDDPIGLYTIYSDLTQFSAPSIVNFRFNNVILDNDIQPGSAAVTVQYGKHTKTLTLQRTTASLGIAQFFSDQIIGNPGPINVSWNTYGSDDSLWYFGNDDNTGSTPLTGFTCLSPTSWPNNPKQIDPSQLKTPKNQDVNVAYLHLQYPGENQIDAVLPIMKNTFGQSKFCGYSNIVMLKEVNLCCIINSSTDLKVIRNNAYGGIFLIDTNDNSFITPNQNGIQLDWWPTSIAFDNSSSKIYVANFKSDAKGKSILSVIDPNDLSTHNTIEVDHWPWGLAMDSKNDLLYVVHEDIRTNAISIVDTSSNPSVSQLQLGRTFKFMRDNAIFLTNDGSKLCIVSKGDYSIIDTKAKSIAGKGRNYLGFQARDSHLYYANGLSNYIYDLSTSQQIGQFHSPNSISRIKFSSDWKYLSYFCNNSISIRSTSPPFNRTANIILDYNESLICFNLNCGASKLYVACNHPDKGDYIAVWNTSEPMSREIEIPLIKQEPEDQFIDFALKTDNGADYTLYALFQAKPTDAGNFGLAHFTIIPLPGGFYVSSF